MTVELKHRKEMVPNVQRSGNKLSSLMELQIEVCRGKNLGGLEKQNEGQVPGA